MGNSEKTVFISYRRTDKYRALAVYEILKEYGFDVFFDFYSIRSGDFEQIIVANIKARAHFLVILTPTALDRCNKPDDWLRREIETAITEKRNIIPLFFDGFDFAAPSISGKLTGKLGRLQNYNGLEVPSAYFEEAMDRLRDYLNVDLEDVPHPPVPVEVQREVKRQKDAADKAILRGKSALERSSNPVTKWIKRLSFKQIGIGGVALLVILSILFAMNSFLNKPSAPGISMPTILPSASPSDSPTISPNVAPSIIPLPTSLPVPTLGVGSLMTSRRDGMDMVYVPAGEFKMGSDDKEFPAENPAHTVALDAYWIDRTEVTNAMYASCVKDGNCDPPSFVKSSTRDNYYGNPEFDNYPVVYVSWNAANAYCSWAGGRLPNEAEWEKAAGWDDEKQVQRLYPWGNSTFDGSKANFCDANCKRKKQYKNAEYDDGYADTAPVGNYPAGASFYGALDMAGNVWEWVTDWYDAYPGGDKSTSQYFGQTYRVVRGSSWFFTGDVAHTTNRAQVKPDEPNDAIGFRCVLSASE